MEFDEFNDFLNGFDPETATPEEFDAFCKEASSKIGAEIAQAAFEHPDMMPELELLAKLLAVTTEPEKYLRNETLSIPNFGEYHFTACPLIDNSYGVIVSLDLPDGTHMGPAAIHTDPDLETATQSMHELRERFATERPSILKDINDGFIWDTKGVWIPYDSDKFKFAFDRD